MFSQPLTGRWHVKTGLCLFDIRWYRSQGQWSPRLWLTSVTTVDAHHMSGLWWVYLPRRKCIKHYFSHINISHGSVVTCLRSGRTVNDDFIGNLLLNVLVQKILKIGQYLVKIWTVVWWLGLWTHGEYAHQTKCTHTIHTHYRQKIWDLWNAFTKHLHVNITALIHSQTRKSTETVSILGHRLQKISQN